MIADPRNHSQVACIAPTFDMVQQVKLQPASASFQLSVGSAGYGFAVINPTTCGPTKNPVGWYSTPAFGGVSASTFALPQPGLVTFAYADPALANSNVGDYSQRFFRTTACGVYISPSGSATSQNGRIFLHEAAGHSVRASQVTLGDIKSSRRTRPIRGTQMGDQAILNLLNWHPKNGAAWDKSTTPVPGGDPNGNFLNGFVNDVTFRSFPGTFAIDLIQNCELVILVTGEVGAIYDVDVLSYYELIGPLVDVNIPVVVSGEQFDIVRNGLAQKQISGAVGKPREIAKAYEVAVEHVHRTAHGKAVPDQPWYRSLIETAKDVGGFALAASSAVNSLL